MDINVVSKPHIDIVFNTKDLKNIWDILFVDIPTPFQMRIDFREVIKSKYIVKDINPWSTLELVLNKKKYENGFTYGGTFYVNVPTGNEKYPQDIYSFTAFFLNNENVVFSDLMSKFAESIENEQNIVTIERGSIKAFDVLIRLKYDFSDNTDIVCDKTGFGRFSVIDHGTDLEPTTKIVKMP